MGLYLGRQIGEKDSDVLQAANKTSNSEPHKHKMQRKDRTIKRKYGCLLIAVFSWVCLINTRDSNELLIDKAHATLKCQVFKRLA